MIENELSFEAYEAYCDKCMSRQSMPISYIQFEIIFEQGQQSVIDKVNAYSDDTTAAYIKSQLKSEA
jgi:hypothetical protein